MKTILHILTKEPDPLVSQIIASQTSQKEIKVEVVKLNVPDPDYTALVEQIFQVDSVAVW